MPPELQPRKLPQQERSRQLRARIVEATIRVLREEGALGFTTTRVAEEAGVSVGSLYQYFPNKHALVMAAHSDDIAQGWEHIESLLDQSHRSPRERLTAITQWFFISEAQEIAESGAAVGDIDVFLRGNADNNPALLLAAGKRIEQFLAESSTRTRTAAELRFDARFMWTTIESVGKSVARKSPSTSTIKRWASATSKMLADHLDLSAD